MDKILETLEKKVRKLFNKSILIPLLAGPILTSCQRLPPKPESPLTFYEFVGTVKGESKGEYASSTPYHKIVIDSYGHQNVVVGQRETNDPEYAFVLETVSGLRTFTTLNTPTELDALINVGDEVKVQYFGDTSPDSPRFCGLLAIREINGKKVNFFTQKIDESRMRNSRVIKVD